jgi:hypothetical protein
MAAVLRELCLSEREAVQLLGFSSGCTCTLIGANDQRGCYMNPSRAMLGIFAVSCLAIIVGIVIQSDFSPNTSEEFTGVQFSAREVDAVARPEMGVQLEVDKHLVLRFWERMNVDPYFGSVHVTLHTEGKSIDYALPCGLVDRTLTVDIPRDSGHSVAEVTFPKARTVLNIPIDAHTATEVIDAVSESPVAIAHGTVRDSKGVPQRAKIVLLRPEGDESGSSFLVGKCDEGGAFIAEGFASRTWRSVQYVRAIVGGINMLKGGEREDLGEMIAVGVPAVGSGYRYGVGEAHVLTINEEFCFTVKGAGGSSVSGVQVLVSNAQGDENAEERLAAVSGEDGAVTLSRRYWQRAFLELRAHRGDQEAIMMLSVEEIMRLHNREVLIRLR